MSDLFCICRANLLDFKDPAGFISKSLPKTFHAMAPSSANGVANAGGNRVGQRLDVLRLSSTEIMKSQIFLSKSNLFDPVPYNILVLIKNNKNED